MKNDKKVVYKVWGFNPRKFDFGRTDVKSRLAWFKKIEQAAEETISGLSSKVSWKQYAGYMSPWVGHERHWEGKNIHVEIARESFEKTDDSPETHDLWLCFSLKDEEVCVNSRCANPKNWNENPNFQLVTACGSPGKILKLIEVIKNDWPNLKPVKMSQK